MRALIIGKEGRLHRRIKELEAAGYTAVEVPGAVHLGRGVWIFPVEVTAPEPLPPPRPDPYLSR